MAKLIDQSNGSERQLVKSMTLLGRAEYCDVCVRSRIVSREHARILRKLTGYYIEDLGSTHGTRVNGVRIHHRAKLRDGDVITIARMKSGAGSSTRHPPHTDTSTLPRQTPSDDGDTAHGDEMLIGASLCFRK